jgi:hypothetical protein
VSRPYQIAFDQDRPNDRPTRTHRAPPIELTSHCAINPTIACSARLGCVINASTWWLRGVPCRHHSQKCSQLLVNSVMHHLSIADVDSMV